MKKNIYQNICLFILFGTIIFPFNNLNAQSCGFGCLGLSGIYGGYTIQYYHADGLNDHIKLELIRKELDEFKSKFEFGKGFRIGSNLFRAKFDEYFITAKGFYQFLKEKHTYSGITQEGNHSDKYEFIMNYWGVGIDVGIPLFEFLDWKIFEGGVTIYNTELLNESFLNNEKVTDLKYENSKTNVGYYISSGVIIHLIPDYISLEGTAIYNMITIENLKEKNGEILPNEIINKNLVDGGGFAATIQLNIGVPL